MFPCCGPDEKTPRLFQRPILRLIAQGQAMVSMFFILSGFVNALKPLKLARAGNVESALSNLAVSSSRRSFRLVLPATLATIISWLLTNLGAYRMGKNSDAYWLRTHTPLPSSSWGRAIGDLVLALRSTWSLNGGNPYDQPQWVLLYLLQGSMMVFIALLITVNLTSLWRIAVISLFYVWSLDWSLSYGEPYVGFNVFAGAMLAETFLSTIPQRLLRLSPLLAPPLTVLALVLMSMPLQADGPEKAGWSNFLLWLSQQTLPRQYDIGRFYTSVGSQLLVFTVIISPHLRRVLSHPVLLWLGKISFPMYLLHGTLMRSIFAWMMFFGSEPRQFEEQYQGHTVTLYRYPLPGPIRTAVSILVFMFCVFVSAHFWALYIEPWFAKITKLAENRMTGKDGLASPKTLIPTRQD